MPDSFTHLHRAHRVLDARRCGPGRRRGGAGRGRRAAGGRDHRPRQHVRDPRLLQGVPRNRASSRSSAPSSTWPTTTAPSGRPAGAAWTTPAARPRAGARPTTTSPRWPRTHTGYKNLIQLSSRAYLEGYYMKPKVDWELLEAHHEGIIATTGCLGGQVLQALHATATTTGALEKAARLQDIFGRDNLFVEIQDHGIPEQHRTNPQLLEIARKIGAPLLATNDSHYTHQHDAVAHDALLCVQTGSLMSDPDRFKFHGDQHYLKTAAEMRHLFARGARGVRQHALDRRALRTSRSSSASRSCRTSRCPRASPTTPTTSSTSPSKGARQRWGDRPARRRSSSAWPSSSRSSATWASASYFLIVWDLIKHARDGDIRVGPGRGSRRRLRGGLLPAHHRPRPDQVRPALRALPQPEPHLDARHRHGLRLPLPGRDDPLRGRALRPRPRRPDRHLLHHQGPGRGARRGPGARLPLRRRRQGGQGHAAARHGPRHAALRLPRGAPEVRRRLQDGRRPARDVRHRPRRPAGHRRRPGPRGPAPPGRHPRRRGGDHQGAAHRVPARSSASPRRARIPSWRPSSPSTRCTGSRSSAC